MRDTHHNILNKIFEKIDEYLNNAELAIHNML